MIENHVKFWFGQTTAGAHTIKESKQKSNIES